MIITYVVFQLSIWWLIHTIMLTYSIRYPFQAQMVLVKGRKRTTLHMICVVLGMLLPMAPILASVADYTVDVEKHTAGQSVTSIHGFGFGAPDYPPIICTAINKDIIFYSSIVPMGVVLGIGGSVLTVCVWLIQKVSIVI